MKSFVLCSVNINCDCVCSSYHVIQMQVLERPEKLSLCLTQSSTATYCWYNWASYLSIGSKPVSPSAKWAGKCLSPRVVGRIEIIWDHPEIQLYSNTFGYKITFLRNKYLAKLLDLAYYRGYCYYTLAFKVIRKYQVTWHSISENIAWLISLEGKVITRVSSANPLLQSST